MTALPGKPRHSSGLRAGPVLAAVALLLVGCDGASTPAGSSSSDTPGPAPTTAAAEPDRDTEALLIAEYNDRLMACMQDQGFDVQRLDGPQGGWDLSIPGDVDTETYMKLMSECSAAVGQPSAAPVTPEEASGMYDLTLGVVDCLEALGASVPEPPSRESWVDTFLTGRSPWTPYQGPEVYDRFGAACPEAMLDDLR